MEYFIYGLIWGIFWEWFNRQQGEPIDDFSRIIMYYCGCISVIVYNRLD